MIEQWMKLQAIEKNQSRINSGFKENPRSYLA